MTGRESPNLVITFNGDILFRALLGFVSRQEAEEFLKTSEVGTFLIRFSDSELGGVTVAWSSRESLKLSELSTSVLYFSERDQPGERGGHASAFYKERFDDQEPP